MQVTHSTSFNNNVGKGKRGSSIIHLEIIVECRIYRMHRIYLILYYYSGTENKIPCTTNNEMLCQITTDDCLFPRKRNQGSCIVQAECLPYKILGRYSECCGLQCW